MAAVETTDGSFHFAAPILYVHGINGNSPASHSVLLGITSAFANVAREFNAQVYEPRVRGLPAIRRQRDPVFFGKVEFEKGTVTLDNTDGEFDRFALDNDVFGNAARIRLGFDDLAFSEYRLVYAGFMETIKIGRERMTVDIQDRRKTLLRPIPTTTFKVADFADLDPDNEGRVIPLAYGTIRNAPVVVTNELEGGSPQWNVKLVQALHAIDAIGSVRVNGVVVTPASTDLVNGELVLNFADFTAGDAVTVDFVGYEDDTLLTPIENALDVIVDLLTAHFADILFTSDFFNIAQWEAAELLAPDVGIFIDESGPVVDFIEDISSTAFGTFLVQDDGRFSYRIFADPGAVGRTIRREEILGFSDVDYDPSEAITSTLVGHSRDWAAFRANERFGAFLLLPDISQETALFLVLKVRREGQFDTLLTSAVAAQAFSDTVLDLQGSVQQLVTVTTKMQTVDLEVGDFVNVQLDRPVRDMLEFFITEVIGVTKNLTAFEMQLDLRLLRAVPDPDAPPATGTSSIYGAEGALYGSSVYGASLTS